MFGSGATDGIPTIQNYEDAERIFNKIKPVKSNRWDANTRPIRTRKENHKLLVKQGDVAYAARLYRTDMATYYRDGRIALTRDDHQMSNDFLDAVLPHGLQTARHRGKMWFGMRDDHEWRFYQGERKALMFFEPTGTGTWKLLNPEACVIHEHKTVNRAKSKDVREALKPLVQYINAVAAISNGDITGAVAEGPKPYTPEYNEMLRQQLQGTLDPEHYPKFLSRLSGMRYRWGEGSKSVQSMTRFVALQQDWKEQLTKEAYYVADVFDRAAIPLGVMPPDCRW